MQARMQFLETESYTIKPPSCKQQQQQQHPIKKLDSTLVNPIPLSANFSPNKWTVICGRNKNCYNHIGNRRLRVLIDINFEAYTSTKSKMAKTLIVSNIVDSIREASQSSCGFVKQDPETQVWYEVCDDVAREKIGQLFREQQVKKDPKRLQARRQRRKELKTQNKKSIRSHSSSDTSTTTTLSSSSSSLHSSRSR